MHLSGSYLVIQWNMLLRFQAAAATLITVCQQIGPDLTAVHVVPQLKELFDDLAFSQDSSSIPGFLGKSYRTSKLRPAEEAQIESRMDLVWVSSTCTLTSGALCRYLESWSMPISCLRFTWMCAGHFCILVLRLFLA